jgi:putative ABC transport system permease protein
MTGRHRAVTAGRRGRVPARAVARQSRAAAWPLLLCLLVVTLTSVLTVATPRYLERLALQEVRAAVRGEPDAAIIVSLPFDESREIRQLDPSTATALVTATGRVDQGIDPGVRTVLEPPVAVLLTAELDAGAVGGADRLVRLALVVDGVPEVGLDGEVPDVTSPQSGAVTWLEGGRPQAAEQVVETDGNPAGGVEDGAAGPGPEPEPPQRVEVALSADAATALGAHAGDLLPLEGPEGGAVEAVVSGVYEPVDPAAATWATVPTAVTPRRVTGAAARLEVTALVSDASAPAARLAVPPGRVTRTATFEVRPDALDASAGTVAREVAGLVAAPTALGVPGARVTTRLDELLTAGLDRVEAVTAQASLVLAGVVAGAALVLLLATEAVVRRRRAVLRHQRELGASLPTVATSLAVEALVTAGLGGVVGVLLADRALPGPVPWAWLAPPLVLAAVAGPVLGATAAARSARPGTVGSERGVRRLVVELAVVTLAVAAVVAVRQRGAVASAGRLAADLVVVGVPVLVSAVVALGLVRVLPPLLRGARALLARRRGLVGVLAAARARVGVLGVLVLVLTTASAALALAVGATVRAAQAQGARVSVGGDAVVVARADPGVPGQVVTLEGEPGVDATAVARVVDGVQVLGEGVDEQVRLAVVDPDDLAAYLEASGLPGASALRALAAGDVDSVPALVTGLPQADLTLHWQRQSVALTAVGTAPGLPAIPGAGAEGAGPLVVVPRDAVAAALDEPVTSTVAWLTGPRAAAAVTALADADGRVDGAVVTTRAGWLDHVRQAPVVAGFRWVLQVGAAVLTLLGVLAVALDVTAGAARRAGALAALRVLGVSRRAGVGVLVAETALPVLLPAAAGVATGLGLAALVVGPLGLGSLAGGVADVLLVVPWTVGLPALAVGAAAVVTVLAEAVLRQRVRLAQVMRAA